MPSSEETTHNNNNQQIVQQSAFFSGPLPPPAILAQYDSVVPGAAERILKMAEEQSKHRRDLESQVIAADIANARKGLMFGFIIGVVGLLAALIAALYGKEWVGSVLGVGTLVSLVGTFVYGSQRKAQELEEQRQEEK
jgi:uncharacterized membrane protein